MKTQGIIFGIMLLGLSAVTQDLQQYNKVRTTVVLNARQSYTGRISALGDSALSLRTLIQGGDYFDLFFSYDKIDSVIVQREKGTPYIRSYPVNRDYGLYTRFREDLPSFLSALALLEEQDQSGGLLPEDELVRAKAYRQLKIASEFTTITPVIEAAGLLCYGIGYFSSAYQAIVPGVGLTVAGMDMGKFDLMPIIRAKRILKQGLSTGGFRTEYSAAIEKVDKAITLSAVSLAANVAGEVLLSVGLFNDPDGTTGKILVASGLIISCAGVITSLFSAAGLGDARKALRGNSGAIGLQAGNSGIGIAYHLPD